MLSRTAPTPTPPLKGRCFSLAEAEAMDAADPLARVRARYRLPERVIYLDGNSLGAMPEATAALMRDGVERQWADSLIRGWNAHDWIGAPARVGDKIARLIGAKPGEVMVADSTSVNLFKLIVAAGRLSERPVILTETGNFPTDLQIATGAASLLGKRVEAVAGADVEDAISADTALLVLTHVHYKSGARRDMAALTARAMAAGTRTIWDLSHSIGAVSLDLARDGVELAVGCGYKYLNGGPGAPAFLYVAKALQERLRSPLTGWMGHAAPFDFADAYQPAPGVARFLCGTPPVLSLLALEAGVDEWLAVDAALAWDKSAGLFELFAALMAERCPELECVTPAKADERGSHISFRHPDAWPLCQALIEAGVIGDFRAPDILRFGLTPLYLGFADVWLAVDALADVLAIGVWREARFTERARVT